jgi:acetylornithine/succinyldiaminopimelate/putrescine aminotransferase
MYPIAATVLAEPVAGWLYERGWGHVSTFGGSELGCRVARKVLEITTREEVQRGITDLIERLTAGLAELRARQPYLAEVRQTGLVVGLRVDHPDGAIHLQRELYARGVWAIASGFDQSVLQLKPGLLMETEMLDTVLDRLEDALVAARDSGDRPVPSRHPPAGSRG